MTGEVVQKYMKGADAYRDVGFKLHPCSILYTLVPPHALYPPCHELSSKGGGAQAGLLLCVGIKRARESFAHERMNERKKKLRSSGPEEEIGRTPSGVSAL